MSQTDLNNFCQDIKCGPYCDSSDQLCFVSNQAIPQNFGQGGRQEIFNIIIETSSYFNVQEGCGSSECCSNEKCYRSINKNGQQLIPDKDYLIVFGGIQQILNKDDDCLYQLQNNCEIDYSNDLYMIDIQKNTTFKLYPGPNENGLLEVPTERGGHASVYVEVNEYINSINQNVIRKYMYIFGGVSKSCSYNLCNDIWRYEIPWAVMRYYPNVQGSFWNRGNHWKKLSPSTGSIPTGRAYHKMVVDKDFKYIYIFGGISLDIQNAKIYNNEMWRFDLQQQKWEKLQQKGLDKIQRKIRLWDGTIKFLDIMPQDQLENDEATFLPQDMSQICYQKNNFPSCRAMHGMTQYQNVISLFGGYFSNTINEEYFDDFWEYNIDNSSWKQIFYKGDTNNIPKKRRNHDLVSFYSVKNDIQFIFLYGGNDNIETLQDFWYYRSQLSEWKQIDASQYFKDTPLENNWPKAIKGHSLTASKYGLMIFGGIQMKQHFSSVICPLRQSYNYIDAQLLSFNDACSSEILENQQLIPMQYQFQKGLYYLSEIDSCNPLYSNRGNCLFGRLQCETKYYGNQCQYLQCVNSFCFYDPQYLQPPHCIFCNNNGQCSKINGQCECDQGYTGDDCSSIDCINNCNNDQFSQKGICIQSYPQSICQCDEIQQRGSIDCGLIFCLNDCSFHGTCSQITGQCICQENWTGLDCSIRIINLFQSSAINQLRILIPIFTFYLILEICK